MPVLLAGWSVNRLAGVDFNDFSVPGAETAYTPMSPHRRNRAGNAAGIPVGDLGPIQFKNYGTAVTDPQPGDMVMQPGHAGIYLGNGQVLSSGLNGKNETAIHPLTWMTSKGAVTFVRAGA
ncbi:hypothetical protein [Pseudarthrobacter sp. R1]|uniref:hypothetical protein n=1 Tax=Pseudarthrobacter sp. R1 TaxID=2944934 RepID=UPI0027E22783|nr:hypothetical protein [Pseudarthrobacter sp. R1]